jgi:acid phosphatase (class A)
MKRYGKIRRAGLIAPAMLALLLSACQLGAEPAPPAVGIMPPTDPLIIGELRPGSGYLAGFLSTAELPDSAALLASPPADGTAAAQADLERHAEARALRQTDRWAQAAADNELKFPAAVGSFTCILGAAITETETPHLTTLLRRSLADAGRSTYAAKERYMRARPFALLGQESCVPAAEEMLANDGSYPSGHAAVGWIWGLILAGLAPDEANALLQRGYEFGDSRRICGVHWQSDVEAGRLMGAATFARLQSDPVFKAQFELARDELAAARSRAAPPADCPA